MNVFSLLRQCVYPSVCRGCSSIIPSTDIFCSHCTLLLQPVPELILHVTKQYPMPVFAACAYKHPAKTLVTRKFAGDLVACKQLANLMLAFTPIKTQQVDAFIPVPLHWTRYATRGFNQANEIAKVLSKQCNAPVLHPVRRKRKTQYQWKLSSEQRALNVNQAFDLSFYAMLAGTDWFAGKHIVIVDDLCTTGATLSHVATVLAQTKPASLTALVGCRAV